MGIEGRIMCMEQCTFSMSSVAFLGPQNAPKSLAAGASPQTPIRKLTVFPRPLAGFKGPTLRPLFLRGEKEGEGEEGRQNDLCPRAPETLSPPLANTLVFVFVQADIFHTVTCIRLGLFFQYIPQENR